MDYSFANWAEQPVAETFWTQVLLHLLVISLGQIVPKTRDIISIIKTNKACQKIHDEMLHFVMNAPITKYFDVTPAGKILTRFSHDVSFFSDCSPWMMAHFGNQIFAIFSMLAIATKLTSTIAVGGLIIVIIAIIYCNDFVKSYKKI